MKRAIIIVDDNQIKIVVSNVLKTLGINEVHLSHNRSFLEKLFSSYEVVILESAIKLDFASFISSIPEPAPVAPVAQPAAIVPQSVSKPVVQKAPQPLPQSLIVNPKPVQTERRKWIRTTSDSTIIIDDLSTGEEIRGIPGAQKSLAIPPGKPIDLTTLNPEALKKSAILRVLVKNGTIISVSDEDAKKMLVAYDAGQSGTYSITDNSILPSNVSAEAYARMVKSGVKPTEMIEKNGEEMVTADGDDHDAIPIDLGRGMIGHGGGGGGGGGGGRAGALSNEHCGTLSMEQLMIVLEEESAMGAYRTNPVAGTREKAPPTGFSVPKINKLD